MAIKSAIHTAMWAGFSVTENLYENYNGNLLLSDFITYHPASITIKTNKKGRLTEGEETTYGVMTPSSGIYQYTHVGDTRLPLWKTTLLINEFEFNNYYGKSIVEGCYRWHVLKEAYNDMMTIVLDRYGNPLTVVSYPKIDTGLSYTNPITGEAEPLTNQQYLENQLSQNTTDNAFLLLPFLEANMKPDVKVLTGNNNLGDVFLNAIEYCERKIARNLLLPYGFLELDAKAQRQTTNERHIEVFNRVIHNLYKSFVIPFVNQSYFQLQKFNFNRESAKIPPRIPISKFTRPEDRVAMMQMIKGLTENGYFNPRNANDWGMVREMVDALDRKQTSDDLKFIEELLIIPRQPNPSQGAGVADPERKANRGSRTSEGKVKPTGDSGRPTGVSTPLQKPR